MSSSSYKHLICPIDGKGMDDFRNAKTEADKILNNSGYKVQDLESVIYGEKLEHLVHHINTYCK